jgi:3-deoxy-D-manno-octulosonic acid kinase
VTRPEHFTFLRDALHSSDTLYAFAATRADGVLLAGRGVTYRIRTPSGEWVVRRYRRGGAIAKLLRDRYLRAGEPRPWRELRCSVAAQARGVPTPTVMAIALYVSGAFQRGDIATEYVPDSMDLASLGFGDDARDAESRRAGFEAAGKLIPELARLGLQHPDLNLKNLLISYAGGQPKAWVLDLDRCSLKSRADAAAMWARLQRSLAKWERISARSLDPSLRTALEAGYRGTTVG